MNQKIVLSGLLFVLALGAAACVRIDPQPAPEATITVAGKRESVNVFVASLLAKRTPEKLTVSHRKGAVVATFPLSSYGRDDQLDMIKQASDLGLSYTMTGTAVD